MAALDAAFPLTQADHALGIAEHLELNVARALDEFFHVKIAVAESGCGFGLGRVEQMLQFTFCADHPHAAPAPAGRSLHDYGITDLPCPSLGLFGAGDHAI